MVLARGARGQGPQFWPLDLIEDALGDEAARVLPQALRTAQLRVRLPRYQVAMLEYRAEQHHTTVRGALARELDGVASANAAELSAVIPGFAAALFWPEPENAQLPC